MNNFQSTNKLTWNESIHKVLIERELTIVNDESIAIQITTNKTIMSYKKDYIRINKLQSKVFNHANYIWLFKKALISAELVSDRGSKVTYYYEMVEAISQIE